jgi:hypothetical protein
VDLDTLHQQVQALYVVVQNEAQPYGRTMQPVLGEQVLVVFGAPAAQEDHAQRAVLMALRLQQQRRQASPGPVDRPTPWPPVRMSVHTGLVAVGGLRYAAATAMGVVGETVTQAVALQVAAPPGMLLCSEATARLVRGVIRLVATSLPTLPGLPAPVYQILGLHPRRLLSGRRGIRPRSPFVGRQQELAALQAALAQAEVGQGQVVGIVGEPGLGKSRLLTEFRHSLRQRQLTYLAASCLSYAQAAIRAKVHRGLAAAGLAPEETAPYLLHLLEVPAETELTATHSPQAIRARTITGLVQFALAGARQQPLVLAVEDLQWLDPSSEEVLTALVERMAGEAKVLLDQLR